MAAKKEDPATLNDEQLLNKMSEKQRSFVESMVANGGQKRLAAEAAGYSPGGAMNSATNCLRNPYVAAYLNRRIKKASDKCQVDAEYVISRLKQLAEDAIDDDDRKNANKSLELLGKYLKLFTDKIDVGGEGITFNLNFTRD